MQAVELSREEKTLPANVVPQVTQLSPIQMAYQLVHAGHDLAAVKEMIEFGKTDEIFIKPQDKRTEDYITGRMG